MTSQLTLDHILIKMDMLRIAYVKKIPNLLDIYQQQPEGMAKNILTVALKVFLDQPTTVEGIKDFLGGALHICNTFELGEQSREDLYEICDMLIEYQPSLLKSSSLTPSKDLSSRERKAIKRLATKAKQATKAVNVRVAAEKLLANPNLAREEILEQWLLIMSELKGKDYKEGESILCDIVRKCSSS